MLLEELPVVVVREADATLFSSFILLLLRYYHCFHLDSREHNAMSLRLLLQREEIDTVTCHLHGQVIKTMLQSLSSTRDPTGMAAFMSNFD